MFAGRRAAEGAVERKVGDAIEEHVGKRFGVIVRSIDDLQTLFDSEPYPAFLLPTGSKRVVTFLRAAPKTKLALPIEHDAHLGYRAKGGSRRHRSARS